MNTFRSLTLSRKCQITNFLLCDATVLLRWSLQYSRRWLQFANNRCLIQSYFWDQWIGLSKIQVLGVSQAKKGLTYVPEKISSKLQYNTDITSLFHFSMTHKLYWGFASDPLGSKCFPDTRHSRSWDIRGADILAWMVMSVFSCDPIGDTTIAVTCCCGIFCSTFPIKLNGEEQ